jgi:hypothetical protein
MKFIKLCLKWKLTKYQFLNCFLKTYQSLAMNCQVRYIFHFLQNMESKPIIHISFSANSNFYDIFWLDSARPCSPFYCRCRCRCGRRRDNIDVRQPVVWRAEWFLRALTNRHSAVNGFKLPNRSLGKRKSSALNQTHLIIQQKGFLSVNKESNKRRNRN